MTYKNTQTAKNAQHKHTGSCPFCKLVTIKDKDSNGKAVEKKVHDPSIPHPHLGSIKDIKY